MERNPSRRALLSGTVALAGVTVATTWQESARDTTEETNGGGEAAGTGTQRGYGVGGFGHATGR